MIGPDPGALGNDAWERQVRKERGHPSADDFREWQRRAHAMTASELWYARRAAGDAARHFRMLAVGGWYSDEACTYADEMRRRQNAGQMDKNYGT